MSWDIHYKKLEERLSGALGEMDELRMELELALDRIRSLEEEMNSAKSEASSALGNTTDHEMKFEEVEARLDALER